MKKQLVFIAILAILVSVGLILFTNNPFNTEKNRFIGTWEEKDTITPLTFTFFSDGTCSVTNISSTYDIKDGKLVVTMTGEELIWTWSYSFSNNDSILTLTPMGVGQSITLYKQ